MLRPWQYAHQAPVSALPKGPIRTADLHTRRSFPFHRLSDIAFIVLLFDLLAIGLVSLYRILCIAARIPTGWRCIVTNWNCGHGGTGRVRRQYGNPCLSTTPPSRYDCLPSLKCQHST